MAIPKIQKADIINALKYIDKNEVPNRNESTTYVLVANDGKKYPPKYVIAVADYLANGTEIDTEGFNAVEAKNYLEHQGFKVERKQYDLIITANGVQSTDNRFTMDSLKIDNNYKALDVYYKKANGEVITCASERKISVNSMPYLAFQVFEKQIGSLSDDEKQNFPIWKRYTTPNSQIHRGIYTNLDEYKKDYKDLSDSLIYNYGNGQQFIINFYKNVLAPVLFIKECLSRFGEEGDQFILSFQEKDAKETESTEKGENTIKPNPQEKYELAITANSVKATDNRFTMEDLGSGDNYKSLDAYFKKASGEIIRRNYGKGERRNSNQTMPRIAFQVFEKEIIALSPEERESFPVCKYNPKSDTIRGIYTSVHEFKEHRNTIEYMRYSYGNGRQFVIYCWNIFSTIVFVQECLKRFGAPGDQFILTFRDKEEEETVVPKEPDTAQAEQNTEPTKYLNDYSYTLLESKNLIFRGAPGTGKSYLAKQIAADIISNGYLDDYNLLSDEQKKQVEFVQFHPSYDYSDFVEGLRPRVNDDGSMGFELQDGIFKKFVARARKNYEDSQKSEETVGKELSAQEAMNDFFSNLELGKTEFETVNENKFVITSFDDKHINIFIPSNRLSNKVSLNLDEIRKMLESGQEFNKIKDITSFFGKEFATQGYSYDFAIYKKIKEKQIKLKPIATKESLKKYIFIIDEINRGEISKIFGELFFAIDPGYRGKAGEISTQYSNLHSDPNEKFYIPENVYIIGTMNDIDRSVDSFDFAMRRRFRFIELKADEQLEMLSSLEDEELQEEVIKRMTALNNEIINVEGLNRNYQIGAAYFLKLKTLSFDALWRDYLQPLLQEYIQGMYDEEGIMHRFAKAYGYQEPDAGNVNEATQD